MNKADISSRIEAFFNDLGWSKAKFADAIGEYPQHLNKVFEGKLDPLKYVDNLAKIGCNKEWLLTGKGNMRVDLNPLLVKETTPDYKILNKDEQFKLLKSLWDGAHKNWQITWMKLVEAESKILILEEENKILKEKLESKK